MKKKFILFLNYVAIVLLFLPASSYSQTCKRPNVILIICDDMRYDAFGITGGPSFLTTPSIDRIANEGARIDNYYCTYSLCIPSRASMMTAFYPHSSGAIDNCNGINAGIPTLAQVMSNAGYTTAMIGKYHINDNWQPGWNYWLVSSGKLDYTDPTFNYFNTSKTIDGNFEQVVEDSVHRYLSTVDTPFFITIGHLAPHRKCTPLPQYKLLYKNQPMPIPPNFYPFTKWYPSFLYDDSTKLYLDTTHLDKDYEGYFEGILGIEDNTTDILNILTQRNLLDNTMIIFTSDNGAVFGEHILAGKGEEYEPSIHLPLFIRYPKWYAPNTVINGNFFCLNIDIMPTILDAACINATPYHMQGTSFRKLVSGQVARPYFLYETIKLIDGTCKDIESAIRPSLRAVITPTYKYTTYHCDQETEEFFNLANDPLETTNLIHDSGYQDTISYYRSLLDSLRIQYSDTLSTDTGFRSCYLVKAPKSSIHHTGIGNPFQLRIDPNPATQSIDLFGTLPGDGPATVTITNVLGEILYYDPDISNEELASKEIDVGRFPQGIYFVEMKQGDETEVKKMLKE